MDVFDIEHKEAVGRKKTILAEDTTRPPLVPSEKHNAAAPAASRKLRTREISSRYKSGIATTHASTPSAPRRCPSPSAGRTSSAPGTSLPKRAQSAERRRPSTPTSRYSVPSSPSSRPSTPSSPSSRPSTPSSPSSRSTTPVRDSVVETQNSVRRLFSGRSADGLWPSMRSLSSSFNSGSASVSVTKKDGLVTKTSLDRTSKTSTNVGAERKRTPLRGRNVTEQSENHRPVENSQARAIDQHRWPGIMGAKLSANALSRSMDLTGRVNRSTSIPTPARGVSPRRMSISDALVRGQSVDLTDRANRSAPKPVSMRGVSPKRTAISDGEGGGLQQSKNDVVRQVSSDGSRRTEHDNVWGVNASSQPLETSASVQRPNRTQSSPIPAFHRPASPHKSLTTPVSGLHRPSSPNRTSTMLSTTRGMISPSRTRPSTPFSSSGNVTSRTGVASSVLNYISDLRKVKKNSNHLEDAHQLRLLYNRALHWRFVNAQSDDVLSIQKLTAENTQYAVWNATAELRDAVVLKRVDLQQLRQEMKLNTVLKEQMAYLEEWTELERDHTNSLSGAIEALTASTLRLPVTGSATADVRAVRNAVSSAVDVMQAMGSSVCHLLSKVEGIKCVASELSIIAEKERAMLDECREILASAAMMQVQESSLRTHLIQLTQDVHLHKTK